MDIREIWRVVDQWFEQNRELLELRKAVGPFPYRMERIRAASGKPISETMTALLALVTFAGYELFPAKDARE